MAHLHDVIDTDPIFIIDPDTRKIKNSSTTETTIIQFDHNSERFTFRLPRYIDRHDMSLCDTVEVHYVNIGTDKTENRDVYRIDDMHIAQDGNGEDVVEMTWLISQNATQLVGSLYFLIRFKCTVDGKVTYAWHTAIHKAVSVTEGMNNGETIEQEYPDILAQFEARLVALEENTNNHIYVQAEEIEANVAYIQPDEPVCAPDGAFWLDTDDTAGSTVTRTEMEEYVAAQLNAIGVAEERAYG